MREVMLVQPKMIATLGNVPLQAFLGKHATVGDCHGRVHLTQDGLQVFAMYHPASVIYRPQLKSVYREDVLILRDMLG